MLPEITVNFLAVIVCVALAMPLGFLWFGPLFGKVWASEMGLRMDVKPSSQAMVKSMLLYALSSFLIVWVLAHSLEVWMPTAWKMGENAPAFIYALNAAFWTWLGFFLPLQIGRVAWEMKSWKLVAINASFDLVRLLVFGFILAYWQ